MAGDWSWLETDGSETPVSLEWNDGDPLQAAGLFVGRDVDEDAIIEPLTTSVVGEPLPPLVPRAPGLVVTQTSQTTAELEWTPAPPNGSPVSNWIVQRRSSTDDGANFGAWSGITGSPFAADVFTASQSSLPTGTPEIVFQYQAWGVNGDGAGDASPIAEIQFGGGGGAVPPNPNNLTVAIQSSTSVFLDWTEAVDLTVDKHAIYKGNVLFRDNLDATATSYQWNDVEPGVPQLNVNIRRFNEFGWSGGTNWIDFTTPGAPRVWPDDPVMGQSVPDNQDAQRTQIDAIRIYNAGDVISKFNQFDPRVIAYTAPGGNGTQASIVTDAENVLQNFYEGTGSGTAARQNCEMHMCASNEIDVQYQNATSLPQAAIDRHNELRQLIHETVGGVRRFPNASLWIDMTANNIRSNGTGTLLKPLARFLDGHACSYYPAGRTIQASNPLIEYNTQAYPAGSIWSGNSRNNYTYYVDPIFASITDWRNTGGPGGTSIRNQLNMLACWEIGIPIHHSLPTGQLNNLVRTGTDATDITQRPRYLVGGARTSGPTNEQYNFEGLLNHIQAYCQQQDIAMREMLYWNQWSNTYDDSDAADTSIPNPWEADAGKTNPDSVTAWYSWSPGFRLPNI